ncbi:MAG TPA: metallopeptidase TldD-related protein [Candidatus Obscuribacterales bacterium]
MASNSGPRDLQTALVKSSAASSAPAQEGALIKAMKQELDRSMSKLKNAGDAPLYFLAYRITETEGFSTSAEYGALDDLATPHKSRSLDVQLRVGSPKCDNTHPLREDSTGHAGLDFAGSEPIVLDDDPAAIRAALWLATDRLFRTAQQRYAEVKANKDIKVPEEDQSDDFSVETPHVFSEQATTLDADNEEWEARAKRLSAIFRDYPEIHNSSVTCSANKIRRYIVNSEGTVIQDCSSEYRIFATAEAIASDGMKVFLYDGVEAPSISELPDDAKLEALVKHLAVNLTAIRRAPAAEPYVGPAILKAKAAGVFFHEIFGHRIEGHRQKDEEEGRTFAKKVGQQVMPSFITVIDDPTLKRLKDKALNGFYQFDDEGVPAQRVVLVDKGKLRNFLMARSPVYGFSHSNGHGRSSVGRQPCARQGNLIVESSNTVQFDTLKKHLINEVKRQGKPYGLIFDEVAGGFTMTQTFMPQVFKLMPLKVTRVYADGRPDELVRGVDLVGTPLASLERIMQAADDTATFNGTCGAESGWVPVSASSPSLLVQTIEVERSYKSQDKPPILPDPSIDGRPRGGRQ